MITYRAEILDEVERRRLDLSIGLLRVYNYYRVLVGLGLLAAAAQTAIGTRFGQARNPLGNTDLGNSQNISIFCYGFLPSGVFEGWIHD